MSKIKLLVVDDSAVVRKYIKESLSPYKEIEIVGTALDPYIATEKIKNLHPDVLTLDIEMPRMDGLTFLSKLMLAHPLPVIMVSSLTDKGAKETIKAMENGAVDFVLKPDASEGQGVWKKFAETLAEKIIMAAKANIKKKTPVRKITPVLNQNKHSDKIHSSQVIAIGASTGGTEVISKILTSIPKNMPGIVVTQHMPPKFTEAFANRLDSLAKICIKEAENGDRLYNGCAYIAPGGTQMLLQKDSRGYYVEVNDDPPMNRHKPSVDVLFNSVAKIADENALGIILTGMGNDGARGLLEMKESGAFTIAQDQDSCIVFGMPREAIKLGAADKIKNIEQIINFMLMNYEIK